LVKTMVSPSLTHLTVNKVWAGEFFAVVIIVANTKKARKTRNED